MNMNAWPFLVSRNQSVDYKTIVAPDFIDIAKLRSLLTKVTEGDRTPPNLAYIRWIEHSKLESFSVVFRVIEARAEDIGENSNYILKDSCGRSIYLVEGLIIQVDPKSLQGRIESCYMKQAHAQIKAAYKHFWYTSEITTSSRFLFQKETSSQTLELEELEPILVSPKPGGTVMPHSYSWKPKLQANSLLILITTAIVFILFSLFMGQLFGGADTIGQAKTSENCDYVTQLQRIPYSDSTEWLKALEELEAKNQHADLFISTVSSEQASVDQNIVVEEEEESTFKQDRDGTVQMKFHPLQQAVAQLHSNKNSKFVKNTVLEVRMVKPSEKDNDRCFQNL